MKLTHEEIRAAAEADLLVFIRLLAPHLLLGVCHEELIKWWQSGMRKRNCMVLLPRGHLKSKLIAYKTAWELTREPESTILYVSATSDLAEKQLGLIKKVLTSRTYQKYWPDMIHPEEGKRETWTQSEIAIDHPKRKLEGVRDPSVKAAGLTTNITGFHATNVKLDDVVVPHNAYTEDGRNKVAALISQIASIKEPESIMDCVGTRYHPKDQYSLFLKQSYKVYDEETGDIIGEEYVWDSYIRVVEEDGVFLWPRARRDDGKSFGFNLNELSRIRAEYEDKGQFYSQYYNNPNDPTTARIKAEKFQYYDRKFIKCINDRWHFNDKPLNVFAAIDFAFSMRKKADSTAVVVIGVDSDNNYYILDIDRFKSDRISDYFAAILKAYQKWGFKKIRCEVTTAQQVIVRDIKENYIRAHGLNLVVDEYRPSRHEGNKEERVAATLEPKYDNMQMWHYKGGYINDLEEELTLAKPPHDDIKDALTAAIDIAVAPRATRSDRGSKSNIIYSSRFGGVAFAK
jgi:hypothetical protein